MNTSNPQEKCTNPYCHKGTLLLGNITIKPCPTCLGTGYMTQDQNLEAGERAVKWMEQGCPTKSSLEAQAPSNSGVEVKSLGVILREGYDEYWEQNKPKNAFGTVGYYERYHAQNEFVAKKIADFVLTDYKYVEFILSRRDALSHLETVAQKIQALLALCEKLDPRAEEIKKISASPVSASTVSEKESPIVTCVKKRFDYGRKSERIGHYLHECSLLKKDGVG